MSLGLIVEEIPVLKAGGVDRHGFARYRETLIFVRVLSAPDK